MSVEITAAETSKVWWKGALTGAVKGIPQGILLGLGGALMLWGLAAAFPALGLASVFHGFLFTSAVGASSLTINPVGFIALNTVLTVVGNFITSGNAAVGAYKQDVEHRMNEARISQIESRELALEHGVNSPSRAVQKILDSGRRSSSTYKSDAQFPAGTIVEDKFTHIVKPRDVSFHEAEETREQSAPASPTLH